MTQWFNSNCFVNGKKVLKRVFQKSGSIPIVRGNGNGKKFEERVFQKSGSIPIVLSMEKVLKSFFFLNKLLLGNELKVSKIQGSVQIKG